MSARLSVCLIGLLLGLLPCVPLQAQIIDRVLAVVNDEALTLQDYQLRHRLEARFGGSVKPYTGEVSRQLLDQLVIERLQLQEVERLNLSANPDAVAEIESAFLIEHNLTLGRLPGVLAKAGLQAEQLRRLFVEQQQIQQLVRYTLNRHVRVDEREIADYLARHGEQPHSGVELNLAYLRIDTANPEAHEIMSQLQAQLQTDNDFEAVAAEIEALGGEGQVLGWRSAELLPELFLDTVQDLPVPGLSPVIRHEDRLYLLQLRDRRYLDEKLLTQYRVRHLLLRRPIDETEAEFDRRIADLRAQLNRGEDFARLARLHSEDQVSRQKDGELGWIGEFDVSPEFWGTLGRLRPGEISRPLVTPAGTHLLEVLDERTIPERRERLRGSARRILFERKAAGIYEAWLSNLRATAHVDYIDPSA